MREAGMKNKFTKTMKLTFTVKKKSSVVFDYLTNMQKFVSVHPVITRIDDLRNDHYLVHETLKLGVISFSFTYPVMIKKDAVNNEVIIRATVMKLTKIEMTFKLTPESGSTVIEENIKFKSHLPVVSIMESIFEKQHSQLFKNIELSID